MAATITVRRDGESFQDIARSYKVLIDGSKVGKLRRGKELTHEVDPGEHDVQMKIDWTKSEKLDVKLKDGEEATFVCYPPGTTRAAGAHAIAGAVGKEGYIQLERE
jgi:hypothetical protein